MSATREERECIKAAAIVGVHLHQPPPPAAYSPDDDIVEWLWERHTYQTKMAKEAQLDTRRRFYEGRAARTLAVIKKLST